MVLRHAPDEILHRDDDDEMNVNSDSLATCEAYSDSFTTYVA